MSSSHISLERLSSYIDSELSATEASALERHLEECASCQDDLRSLRRVIDGLRSLERAAPPSVLAQQVERRVALERPPRGLVQRLEAQLGRRSKVDSGLALGFALVLALAAIVYLFADAVDRRQQRQVPIVVPSAGAPLEEADAIREVGDRLFRLHDGVWVEDGAGDPARRLASESDAGRDLRRELPWLDALLAEARGVVLLAGGESVAIDATEPAEDHAASGNADAAP